MSLRVSFLAVLAVGVSSKPQYNYDDIRETYRDRALYEKEIPDRGIQNVTAEGEYGKEAVLTCEVFPDDEIVMWLFEGRDLEDTPDKLDRVTINSNVISKIQDDILFHVKESILTIASPTEEDAGSYTCASHGYSQNVDLDLSFPERLVNSTPGPVKINMTYDTTDEERILNLTCVFEVFNQSKIEWIRVMQQDGQEHLIFEGNTTRNENNLKQLTSPYTAMNIYLKYGLLLVKYVRILFY